MFGDIGFPELLVILTVALLVLGPSRLPEAVRTLGRWYSRLVGALENFRNEFDRELKMDELRQDVHNERILKEQGEDPARATRPPGSQD